MPFPEAKFSLIKKKLYFKKEEISRSFQFRRSIYNADMSKRDYALLHAWSFDESNCSLKRAGEKKPGKSSMLIRKLCHNT